MLDSGRHGEDLRRAKEGCVARDRVSGCDLSAVDRAGTLSKGIGTCGQRESLAYGALPVALADARGGVSVGPESWRAA
jgi:hypothetical protein